VRVGGARRPNAAKLQRIAAERLSVLQARVGAIALASIAAGVAWVIAREVGGEAHPFFAPVAAVLALGLSIGHQVRRAVEVSLGVALGIVIADGLVLLLGAGGWQLVVVLFLTMSAAVLIAGGTLLINQAAITAIFIVVVQPPSGTISDGRLIDALIGGAVAVLARSLVPNDPLRIIESELTPLTSGLSSSLEMTAAALHDNDLGEAQAALERARDLDPEPFIQIAAAARETVAVTPGRRRASGQLERIAHAVPHIEHALLNTRVLTRASVSAIERGEHAPEKLTEGIALIASATSAAGRQLAGDESLEHVEVPALQAAREATLALAVSPGLGVGAAVNQVRLIATDLLLASGVERRAAVQLVRRADAPAP